MACRASLLALHAILLLLAIELSTAEFDFDECSKSKNCVTSPGDCRNESACDYAFSYAKDGTNDGALVMELFTKRNGGKVSYVAVGFSADQLMGDEGVTACTTDGNKVEVRMSYNDGQSNKAGGPDDGTTEIQDFNLTHDTFYCKFLQRSRPGSTEPTRPDLGSKPYYLLLARGIARGGNLGAHSFDTASPNFPIVSPSSHSLFSAPVGGKRPDSGSGGGDDAPSGPLGLRMSSRLTLVKFHAFLMIVAWLGMVMLAIFTARFMKAKWSDSNLCGVKLWFSLHRGLNVAAVVLMVVSFLCVFVGRDFRWTGPWFTKSMDENLSVGKIHSLIGMVSVILAISQPLNSLLRCAPAHPKRYQFNLAHRTIGLAGVVLAITALVIAAWRFKKYWLSATAALILLILFVIAASALVVVSEVSRSRQAMEQAKVTAIEMNGRGKSKNGRPAQPDPYHHTQNTKRPFNPNVLFALAAGACTLTVIIYAVLIWGH